MRIISLLPAASEILHVLGATSKIVGRSSECTFPPKIKNIPIVVSSKIPSSYSSKYIDKIVSQALKSGNSLYHIRGTLFKVLKPDLVITQKLCEICAITPTDIQTTLRHCRKVPPILSLHPHSIKEILNDIITVGEAIGRKKQAKKYVEIQLKRIETIKSKTKKLKKPRVYCMEWLDPPYSAGHWVPEQVAIAGGKDTLATKGIDSARLLWSKIVEYNPQVLILMPCGFSMKRTLKELPKILQNLAIAKKWNILSAVKNKKVYVVNGPVYFNASGPRVIDGIELLATIFHPKIFNDLKAQFSSHDVKMID